MGRDKRYVPGVEVQQQGRCVQRGTQLSRGQEEMEQCQTLIHSGVCAGLRWEGQVWGQGRGGLPGVR